MRSNLVPAPWGSKVAFVIGAGGFIGSHTTSAFQTEGWRVVGFGTMPSSQDLRLCLHPPQHWAYDTIRAPLLAGAAHDFGCPEVIVHAAGGSAVRGSIFSPERDFDRTIYSVREVLEFTRKYARGCRIIFLSSAAIYGKTQLRFVSEEALPFPISPYGIHKKIAEDLLSGWARLFDLDVSILRLFSVFGPGNRKQLLWDVARQLSTAAKEIHLSGTGDEARDFLYVDDAVRFIGQLAGLEFNGSPQIVNGGTGVGTTVRDLAVALRGALGSEAQVNFTGERRAGDPERLVSDTTQARQLGLQAQVSLEAGLKSYSEWIHTIPSPLDLDL